MKILFICKYNCFRSRVAERLYQRYLPDEPVKSAGFIMGFDPNRETVQAAKEYGLDISGTSHPLDRDRLLWQDKIIIVADDVPVEILGNVSRCKDVEVWPIPDVFDNTVESRIQSIRMIDEKMKNLCTPEVQNE